MFLSKIPINQKTIFQEISGIAVTVWSEHRDFAAVGFIVDQIDALITEWYPGEYQRLQFRSCFKPFSRVSLQNKAFEMHSFESGNLEIRNHGNHTGIPHALFYYLLKMCMIYGCKSKCYMRGCSLSCLKF